MSTPSTKLMIFKGDSDFQAAWNQLHSTEFLLSTFEFERQNIAGCCKQAFCVQMKTLIEYALI